MEVSSDPTQAGRPRVHQELPGSNLYFYCNSGEQTQKCPTRRHNRHFCVCSRSFAGARA